MTSSGLPWSEIIDSWVHHTPATLRTLYHHTYVRDQSGLCYLKWFRSCFEQYHNEVFVDNLQKLWLAFDGLGLGQLNAQNPLEHERWRLVSNLLRSLDLFMLFKPFYWLNMIPSALHHLFKSALFITDTLTMYFYSVFTVKVEVICLTFMLHAFRELHSYLMKSSFKKGTGTSAASVAWSPRVAPEHY